MPKIKFSNFPATNFNSCQPLRLFFIQVVSKELINRIGKSTSRIHSARNIVKPFTVLQKKNLLLSRTYCLYKVREKSDIEF